MLLSPWPLLGEHSWLESAHRNIMRYLASFFFFFPPPKNSENMFKMRHTTHEDTVLYI